MTNQLNFESNSSNCYGTQIIFILGITPRSGTNFLQDLLCLHPDCGAGPIREDFLLHYADFLIQYVNVLSAIWKGWIDEENLLNLLYNSLGNGLSSFLQAQTNEKWLKIALEKEPDVAHIFKELPKRLVTKTPSINNLDKFFNLFPESHLLIIVRDGRAVAESFVKSFGGNYELATKKWAEAANKISEFISKNQQENSNFYIVKYEKLSNNPEQELQNIFNFLNLNSDCYDFNAVAKSSVRGSSSFRGQDRSLHWKAVEKTQEFNPNLRWNHWNQFRHQRFNWIAGEYLVKFGYEKQYGDTNYLWKLWNQGLDVKWWLFNKIKSIIYTLGMQNVVQYIRKNTNFLSTGQKL